LRTVSAFDCASLRSRIESRRAYAAGEKSICTLRRPCDSPRLDHEHCRLLPCHHHPSFRRASCRSRRHRCRCAALPSEGDGTGRRIASNRDRAQRIVCSSCRSGSRSSMIHCSASSSTSSVESHRGMGRRTGPERADSDRVTRSVLRPVDAQIVRRSPSHFRLNPRATTTSWTGPSGRTLDGCCPFLRGNDKPEFFPVHFAAFPVHSAIQEIGSDFQSIIGGVGLPHQVLCRDSFVGESRIIPKSLK
jgi:hypothetical protein